VVLEHRCLGRVSPGVIHLALGDPRLTGPDWWRWRGSDSCVAVVARFLHGGGDVPGLDTSNPDTFGRSLVRLLVLVYSPTTPISEYSVPAP
jgi:hypothetical protein